MARTAEMRLIELMVLKEDIVRVIEYLGKYGCFQFQSKKHDSAVPKKNAQVLNIDDDLYQRLEELRVFFNLLRRKFWIVLPFRKKVEMNAGESYRQVLRW